jgi:adenosylcobyric acid synthase
MFQGTASSVGKSLLTAAFCRIFRQDGYSVAPFKSQNMALNSYVTADGLEMGRAQVMQAEAAGLDPVVEMNPILLKPTSDRGSQLIVMGRPVANMEATVYYKKKEELLPVIDRAYARLKSEFDIVVIEGAGSPAEINLRDKDLVNMGLALRINAPVILIGDIDRGGVFASLYGTCSLLEREEKELLKGVIINKFRGEISLLENGLKRLEALISKPVLGVVPLVQLNLDDEDSLTERFNKPEAKKGLKIQVVRLPHISNFTDFNPLELFEDVTLSYIREPHELDSPDMLILPGSKNTIEDLHHLQQKGWGKVLKEYTAGGGLLAGICGGFQMLGTKIADPEQIESSRLEISGLGFFPVETVIAPDKSTRRVEATWQYSDRGYFAGMKGNELLTGYEIHMGQTSFSQVVHPLYVNTTGQWEGALSEKGNVFGTYLHGLFDNLRWTNRLLNNLRKRRGFPRLKDIPIANYRDHKEKEYDKLAAVVRKSIDIEQVYTILSFQQK